MNLKTISYVTNDESLLDRFTDQCLRPVGFLYRTMFGNDKMKVYRIVNGGVREDVPSQEQTSVVNKVCLFVLGFIAIIPGTVIGGIAKGFSVCTSRHKQDLELLQQFQSTPRTLGRPNSGCPHLSPLPTTSTHTSIQQTGDTFPPLTASLFSTPTHLGAPTLQSEALYTAPVKDETELLSLQEEVDNLRKKITDLNNEKDTLQTEIDLVWKERTNLYERLHSYDSSITKLEKRIEELDEAIQKYYSSGPSLTSSEELRKERVVRLAALHKAKQLKQTSTNEITPRITEIDALIEKNQASILKIKTETSSLTAQRLSLLEKRDALKEKLKKS